MVRVEVVVEAGPSEEVVMVWPAGGTGGGVAGSAGGVASEGSEKRRDGRVLLDLVGWGCVWDNPTKASVLDA